MDKLRVAVVGGGIGGLVAALALRARGLDVTVFEQTQVLREIGAGVSLQPNATRLLRRVGLGEPLKHIGSLLVGVTLRTSLGETIAKSPRPAGLALSEDSEGYNVHRAEFLNMLVEAQPKGTLQLGHRCIGVKEEGERVLLTFENGETSHADIVVGADGIRSAVQLGIGLKSTPTSEGIMAYRGLIPANQLSWTKSFVEPLLWMGNGRSFLCYPVSQGRVVNMVAFVPSDRDAAESWSAPGDVAALAAEYAGWEAPVVETIGALKETFVWGIFDRAPLPFWSTDRMTLLGDAAHPMVPHVGQGAGQAIEDGFALGILLEGATKQNVPSRLKMYERLRRERTSRVQGLAREAGRFYRAEYADASERGRRMAEWMSQVTWLYDYDVEAAASEFISPLG
jgi:salicylate hydroxylase